MAELDELIRRLEAIESDLGDLAIDRLRVALEESNPMAADDEKRISRARRAVEKAAGILAGMPEPD